MEERITTDDFYSLSNYGADYRHLQGILVIARSLQGHYHPQTPPRVAQFRNLVRRFKGHRRELRSARSRMAAKAGKADRIRRVKILVFEANFKLGFPSHLLHPRGPWRSILMKLFARAYIIVSNISLTDPQFSRVNMKDETITYPRQPRPRSFLFSLWNEISECTGDMIAYHQTPVLQEEKCEMRPDSLKKWRRKKPYLSGFKGSHGNNVSRFALRHVAQTL